MNSTPTAPLVSIVVRSFGSPGLPRALASAAAQTWRPIEVVLVDAEAGGAPLRDFADLPVRVVPADWPMDRNRAANLGLAAARGEWIAFLDEQDTIEPEHVALLVQAARAEGVPVAYGPTRLIGADGVQHVHGRPFSRAALLRANYIPIHAAIFHRRLVQPGAAFDESLGPLAEWDFWLQLAGMADFAYAATATATHRSAGAVDDGLPPPEALQEKMRLKWRPR